MCIVDVNCICVGVYEVVFCENGNCYCKYDEYYYNLGNYYLYVYVYLWNELYIDL